MRYFNWNLEKAQEQWFDNEDKISHLTGIKFNQKAFDVLPAAKKKGINYSLAQNNKGYCIVCYADFKKGIEDPEY
jgi:hypothetical protein